MALIVEAALIRGRSSYDGRSGCSRARLARLITFSLFAWIGNRPDFDGGDRTLLFQYAGPLRTRCARPERHAGRFDPHEVDFHGVLRYRARPPAGLDVSPIRRYGKRAGVHYRDLGYLWGHLTRYGAFE